MNKLFSIVFANKCWACYLVSFSLLTSMRSATAADTPGSDSAQATVASSTQAILNKPGFREGLIWTGNTEPSEAESAELLAIINTLDQPGWMPAVESFLQRHPGSPWSASLHHAYACVCRRTGRTTKALDNWEAGWKLIANDRSDSGKTVGGMILGSWTDLLASLGRLETLKQLAKAGAAWPFTNPQDRERFIGAESSAQLMTTQPGVAYRCGTFALKAVAQMLQPGNHAFDNLVEIPSPTNGFSLKNLADKAQELNIGLVPVRRAAGQQIVVPSVVHWRQNHYAAILQEKDGSYLVNDPTFGHPMWLSAEVINEEASGAFLVPRDAVPHGWNSVAMREGGSIRGRGLQNNVRDGKDKGCKNPPAKKDCPCKGMPVWYVSEPYINLWIMDEPLSYFTSRGEDFPFRITYKQRDTRPNVASLTNNNSQVAAVGWNNSWNSFIHEEFSPSNPSQNVSTILFLAGGGELDFGVVQFGPNSYSHDVETGATLQPVSPTSLPMQTTGSSADNGTSGWRVTWPDGSQDIYGFYVGQQTPFGDLPFRDFMRTRHIDPHGNTTYFGYELVLAGLRYRVNTVTDYDGHTNKLAYDSNSLLIGVTNSYGLNVGFGYDAKKNLVRITDAAGMTSTLTYDTNFYPVTLTTPYGTNSFEMSGSVPGGDGNFGGENAIARAIKTTEPTGATSLHLYRYGSPFMPATYAGNEVPTNTPLNTLDEGSGSSSNQLAGVSFRNSFYWNPRQYAALSTTDPNSFTTNDYLRARLRHWLEDTNELYLSGLLSIERDPSPDGTAEGLKTFYDYQGKTAPQMEGTNALPSVITWRLPGAETHYDFSRYDDFANVTNRVTTYTKVDGSLGTRTNQFVFALNTYTNVIGTLDASSNIINTATNTFTIRDILLQSIGPDGATNQAFGGFDTVTWTQDYKLSTQTNRNLLISQRILPRYLTNGVGEVTTFTFTGHNKLTSSKTSAGLTTTNLYDTGGFRYRTIDLEIGRTNSFSYTSNGLVFAHTNELGLATTNTWDNLLRLTGVKFPDGSTFSNRYTYLDLTAAKDRLGNWTYAGYDGLRHLVAVTNANNGVTRLGWCGCGALESITNALNQATQFTYDNQSRRTGIIFPDGSQSIYNYDLAGRVTSVSDGLGRTFSTAYNNQNLPVAVSNAFGRVQAITYDLRDRTFQTTDANNATVTNVFDLLDRVVSRGYADGGVENFGYTPNVLKPTSYTNQLGSNVVNLAYDAALRLTNSAHPGVSTNGFTYNPRGEILTLTDGKNQTTTWHYDSFGRTTNKLDAASNEIFRFQYDANSRLTNRWTPAKLNTSFGYDPVGNLLTAVYQHATNSYRYDAANRMTNMTDAVGTTLFGWTALGQLASEDGPWSSDTVGYGYTERQRTSMSLNTSPSAMNWTYGYDAARRLTNVTSGAGSFAYSYSPAASELIARLLLPGGSYITNGYDSMSRLLSTALKNSGGAVLNSHAYMYDLASERTKQTFKDGNYQDYSYDLIGELKTAKGKESGGSISRLQEQLSYVYDAAGNLNFRTNNGLAQSFGVNNLNELTTSSRSGTFTVAGDTTSAATNVTVNTLTAARYADNSFAEDGFTLFDGNNSFTAVAQNAAGLSATNQITVSLPASSSFVYDLNGNMRTNGSQIYDYDDENQLTTNWVAGARKSEFVYDGMFRRRITRDYAWQGGAWVKTNETRYVYDGRLVLQERDGNNTTLVSYTRGQDLSHSLQGAGGIGGLLARTDSSGSAFYGSDGSGNITALVSSNQVLVAKYAYDPYGNTLSKNGPLAEANAYRFSSKEIHSPSGLCYYGFRFYDLNLQRWLNRDPIGENGGINLFCYVQNDPLGFIDPYGLSWATVGATVGSFAGGLATAGVSIAADFGTLGLNVAATPAEVAAGSAAGGLAGGLFGSLFDPKPIVCETRARGKGERNRAARPDGTPNPYKGWRTDPENPDRIRGKDQNGKDIVKPKPPDFPPGR